MAIAGVILLGIFLIAYDAPALKREKRYKDLALFLVLTTLGLTLSIILLLEPPINSLGIQIENATTIFLEVFKKIAALFT